MESLRVHRFCTLAWIAKGLDSSVVHLVHVLHVLLSHVLLSLLVRIVELLLVKPKLVHLLLRWAWIEDGALSAHHGGLVAPSVLLLRVHVGLVLWLRRLMTYDASSERLQVSLINFVLVELLVLLDLMDSFRVIREIGIVDLVLEIRNLLDELSTVLVVVIDIDTRVRVELDHVTSDGVLHAPSHVVAVQHG